GQAEHGHDLGGGRDVEATLARHAVHAAAQAHHHLTQGSVVHVEDAPPEHLAHVHAEGVAVVEVVVRGGGEELVGGGDRAESGGVAGGGALRGHPVCPPPARATALHAEGGTDGRLAEGDDRLGSNARERLPDADGHGGLAVAGGGGGDRGDDHELAVGLSTAGGGSGQPDTVPVAPPLEAP